MHPLHRVRARFDARSVVVYQAYNAAIASAAVEAQRFVAPFSFERMTWVKPSFFWMMERCGWATKPAQERVLAIRLHRWAFDRLLSLAVPTHFDAAVDATHDAWLARKEGALALVQWDPERTARGAKLDERTIQLGIGRALSREYSTQWIAHIEDVTPLVDELRALRDARRFDELEAKAPRESEYEAGHDVEEPALRSDDRSAER